MENLHGFLLTVRKEYAVYLVITKMTGKKVPEFLLNWRKTLIRIQKRGNFYKNCPFLQNMITVLYDQIFHQFYYLQFIIIRIYILISSFFHSESFRNHPQLHKPQPLIKMPCMCIRSNYSIKLQYLITILFSPRQTIKD